MSLGERELARFFNEYHIPFDDRLREKFRIYTRLLLEWNQKMNLTAIVDPDEIYGKHYVDSLTAMTLLKAGGQSLIDVGSGAGFPGVPIHLARPEIRLTILDSLNKRLIFLETLCRELDIRVELVHKRAEEAGRDPAHRERYDAATARAVAAMPALCEYCLPLVRPGGQWIAMKGPDGLKELKEAEGALKKLGGRVRRAQEMTLSDGKGGGMGRVLIDIEKAARTPQEYPRSSAKIKTNPL